MNYVVYHKDTTRYLCHHEGVATGQYLFTSERNAKTALTREVNIGGAKREDFLIADYITFHTNIEKTFTVTKHGNGSIPTVPYELPVNTPYASDPRFERYWSS